MAPFPSFFSSKSSNMSSTTTFTLPLRVAVPKSLTLDPVFSLLYEDNKKALTQLVDYKTPLTVKDIIINEAFIDYVISKEPGPKVQYQNLRPALSAIRPFLTASPNGNKLMAFYKNLLQLQGRWIMASSEFLAFDMYFKLMLSIFMDQDDKKLMAHVTKMVSGAQKKVESLKNFDRNQFTMLMSSERERLQKVAHAAVEPLFHLKVSKDFWTQHGKLVAAIEHHEKKLLEIRERNARRKAEREARLRALRASNTANLSRQMGMAGKTPHLPHVEDSVCDYTKEVCNDYFSFNSIIG